MSPQTLDLIAALQRAIAQSGVDLSGNKKATESFEPSGQVEGEETESVREQEKCHRRDYLSA